MGDGEESRDFFAIFYSKTSITVIICVVFVWILLLLRE